MAGAGVGWVIRASTVVVGANGNGGADQRKANDGGRGLVLLLHHVVAFKWIDPAAGQFSSQVDQVALVPRSMNVRHKPALLTLCGAFRNSEYDVAQAVSAHERTAADSVRHARLNAIMKVPTLGRIMAQLKKESSHTSNEHKERHMIGMNLRCPIAGITGTVDALAVQPDGKALARIADHWLYVDSLVRA